MKQNIFVYGTLKLKSVQQKILGRTLSFTKDCLENFEISKKKIEGTYPTIIPLKGSIISGNVIAVDEQELKLLDAYEGSAYIRIMVVLKTGRTAWVYLENKKPRH
jgi:gamma-glutamylcyclotransferase (GGCT)/AIG2-like uncharacterized protein YtfP